MRLKNKDLINVFVMSSAVSIITLIYIGFAYNKKCSLPNIHYELFPIFIPLLYGIFGIINFFVIQQVGSMYSFTVGAMLGLMLSIIGRFVLNLPVLIFNFTKHNEYKVHVYAMVLYASIFQLIVTPLTNYLVDM
jgi:hypothetical protein